MMTMHKEGTIVYEMEAQYTKVSRTTDKEYKVWKFISMSPIMEDLEKCTFKIKGKWLIVERADQKYRYNLETKHTVTYGETAVEVLHATWEEELAAMKIEEVEAPEATASDLMGKTVQVKDSALKGEVVNVNAAVNTVWFVVPGSDEWIPARIDQVEEVVEAAPEEMKVSISKKPGEWNVLVNGKVFGECRNSTKHGGSIEAELNDGVIINAFSQSSLKGMIKRHLLEDEAWSKEVAPKYQNTSIEDAIAHVYKNVNFDFERETKLEAAEERLAALNENEEFLNAIEKSGLKLTFKMPEYNVQWLEIHPRYASCLVTHLETGDKRKYLTFPSGKIEDFKYPGAIVLEEVKSAIRAKLDG
jgi:hypothetical protein